MAGSTGPHPSTRPAEDSPSASRHRDAARTRGQLVEAARRRFTHDGYAATTVRDIADDAGVNVSLIHRYFASKEGLFEACLAAAVDDLSRVAGNVSDLSEVPEAIARQVAGSSPKGRPDPDLLLLLRSSGDERAEQIRLGVLRRFGERLASLAGWKPHHPDARMVLLRAQIVLSIGIGIAVLRSTPGLEPLASATAEDLHAPLCEVVEALLSRDEEP